MPVSRAWTMTTDEVLVAVKTRLTGLTHIEAINNHKRYGLNVLSTKKVKALSVLFRQISGNPLVILLSVATTVSYLLGQSTSAYYIFAMILLSIGMGFWNEFFAEKTIETLLKRVSLNAMVLRNNEKVEIPTSQVTIGDIVLLVPGSIIPADIRLIETNNLEVNESVLTGESKTVFKNTAALTNDQFLISESTNLGFMGTVVVNGWGKGVVTAIGKQSEFGKISESVSFVKPETSFQQGLAKFGRLIIKVIIVLTVVIFSVNAFLGHPIVDSILFALAIAVGLAPELLPVIVTVSLSHGAHKLMKKDVLVKQLVAIENLGNMDVLCTDKTGTLTEGKMQLVECLNYRGEKDLQLLPLALVCNTAVVRHKIVGDAIDSALWEYAQENKITLSKEAVEIYEEPFSFEKRAMFTIVSEGGSTQLIAKGAPEAIINFSDNGHKHKALLAEFETLSADGYRVIAIASKKIEKKKHYDWTDVSGLEFHGYCTFLDIPKKSAIQALNKLHELNVVVKVITGDSELITKKICQEVGMPVEKIITGTDLDKMTKTEFGEVVEKSNIFVRISPEQKYQIVQALQKNGHTVGFMGDGINDAPSLHCADVGLSVSAAVDVAKNAASVVLMRKGLDVIAEGIVEGRRIFNNTIKYILMGTSSNFGNMFSAAGASFFLPFLPMLPIQILFNNSLYDISQITIPSDNVDIESLQKPKHFNIDYIKNYMIFFGPISSVYDFMTFGIMYYVFHAQDSLFQTGWFIESLATQVMVIFIIRTSRSPFFMSRPGKWLTITCLSVVTIAIVTPYTIFGKMLGFTPLPPLFFGILALMVTTYLALVELGKKLFLKRFSL